MELREGYLQTDMGIFPEDWEVIKIEDLIARNLIDKPLDGNHGNIHPKSTDFVDSGIPFIMANNVYEGNIDLDDCHFIRKEQADNLQKGFSISGDILLTHKGTVGNVAVVENIDSEYIMLTPQVTYYRIKNSGKLDREYVKQYFLGDIFQKILKNVSGGGTRAYIGIISQRQLPFVLPSALKEQTAISAVLRDTDAFISSLEKLIEKKRAIKQGAMQQLLKPKEGWVVKNLTEVVDYIHGKAHEQHIVDDGKFVVVNSKFVSTEGTVRKFSNVNYCPAKKNDILTVLSDLPNGKALAKCFYVDSNNLYAVNQRVCIWRTKGADARFLFYVLNRNKYFLSINDGVSQTHILNHHINRCIISFPPNLIEQTEISSILFSLDNEIQILEEKLTKYRMVKKGMMQQLLTGKIRLV